MHYRMMLIRLFACAKEEMLNNIWMYLTRMQTEKTETKLGNVTASFSFFYYILKFILLDGPCFVDLGRSQETRGKWKKHNSLKNTLTVVYFMFRGEELSAMSALCLSGQWIGLEIPRDLSWSHALQDDVNSSIFKPGECMCKGGNVK